jgi:predicted ATPase
MGVLCVQSRADRTTDAERRFRDALESARGYGAVGLELRAAISLARLLAARGERDEARSLLAGVHGSFREGFDTADLREARTVLAALGG